MNPEEQYSDNGFTGVTSFGSSAPEGRPNPGNIIKNVRCNPVVYDEFDRTAPAPTEPKVIVHRSNDAIDRIEFVCSCGCSKTVHFRYDGE